jgi:hypothetical protein
MECLGPFPLKRTAIAPVILDYKVELTWIVTHMLARVTCRYVNHEDLK